ncbi:hypothetical protein QTP86_025750, partial [Hemibagrus guttatus]
RVNASERYVTVYQNMGWTEAQRYCREHYTDLTSVRNESENQKIRSVFNNTYYYSFWIGLYRTMSWSDKSNSSFSNWRPGQPNSYGQTKICTAVSNNDDDYYYGKWTDEDCGDAFPFFCYSTMSSSPSRQYHFVNENKTWTEAQRYCRENYTDLATIDNIEEMSTLLETVNGSYTGLAWIGLYGDEDSWRWSLDDDAFYQEGQRDFRGWPHQPDNYNGNEMCVYIRSDGAWFDENCNRYLPFVCYDGRNGTENYTYNNQFMSWTEAQHYCRVYHTDLASVRNQVVNEQILNLTSGSDTWIGLYRTRLWSDEQESMYENWRPATQSIPEQPDNGLNVQWEFGLQHCTAVSLTESGYWTDESCLATIPFFCYKKSCTASSCSLYQYHFINENKTWTEAQRYCRDKYTDLATVNNMEDVTSLLNTAYGIYSGLAWIGLYDDLKSWKWSLDDDSFYSTGERDFRSWYINKPRNWNGNSLCAYFSSYSSNWGEESCSHRLPFICFDGRVNASESYVLIKQYMNWTEAQSYCREHYTDLASVKNETENQNDQIIIISVQLFLKRCLDGPLYRTRSWSDQSNSSFNNWKPGQPDNYGLNESCTAVSFNDSGKWTDENCSEGFPFLCYSKFIPGAVMGVRMNTRSNKNLLYSEFAVSALMTGAGGNWATVGRRSRGGRRVRRQREKRKGKSVGLRIGTLNVGTMTGKGRELADVMERRKVDILCVQETRWKGSKARSIGAGFKMFYYGVDSKRNGVGVVLKEEFVRNVLEVKRVSDRVMSLKLEFEGVMLNVVSGYAPQVGCELEEKERFWSELDEVMESIPTGERVVIGADFNGHVGEGNTGDEEVMGKFGVKERNLEGQMVVDFAKRMDMGVVNTYFQKREEHRVTYKSGGRRTQVDYILCRRGNLKEISDCKVVVGESVARQHRMVLCRMTLMVCKTKRSKIEKKTKWWKLKKEECCEEFRQKLRQALGGQVVLPDDWETTAEVIRETGRKVLGVSSGRRKEDKETWWWNEEVQDSIQRKRLAKKKWDMDRTEENRQEYKELQRRVKREVSKAKQKAYEELYTRLDTREGEKDLYRLARQRDRDGKDVQQVRVIKDRDGRVLTSEESVQRRWKEYFEELMNEENEREKRVEGVNSVEQKVDKIRKDEVRKALKRMKSGKAVGPDDIPVEVWKCLGEAAVEFLANLFNRVLESERMPEEWRRSVLVPIFKNKGDVQSCSNYRGIKLMSHTMKVWERVVEARLRKVVEICEQQYGFMPRKSTTDAIFALRILMEKYRDGQKELHCVFVDLEKAYDRVPREELWYCMRKSGVAEKYVRVVQDMYERSRTVVRCAVGQTEEFNVEVGLHQGSALSPFLFAIVMDQLSEEVRQESPWTMMFADDIVICSESREQVEENLERWRFALERRGMKVSRSKTEYMCVNEREGSGTVRLQGEEVKKVQEFKYLGSTVQSNGECGKEVKKRVQAGWNGWRKVSGVLCDRKISARIKGKVYRTVVRPAMLYGLETVLLRKRQESELEVAELKMLRFSLGVTRLDRIRNEYIRGTAHVGRLGDKVREARLRWFGHVQRRDSEYIGRRMLDMGLPGRRQRGRPKRWYMDVINEDMKLVGARVEDAEDRDRWREMIR